MMSDGQDATVDELSAAAAPKPRIPIRERVRAVIEAPLFQKTIITIIILNAITLGMETSPSIMGAAGPYVLAADKTMLGIFVVEILARLYVHRRRFFRDPWSVFDFIVVGIALMPATNGFSVLRALRVLRVLRLISMVPSMRLVVQALLAAIPGMGSIAALLVLVFYVAAVMATKLFAASFPEWFGTIGASLYSLFQIMTLESWSMGIVRPVMDVYPHAWAFFVPFILIATFTVLNLFIAVVVNAMQSTHEQSHAGEVQAAHDERSTILEEIRTLRSEIAEVKAALANSQAQPKP